MEENRKKLCWKNADKIRYLITFYIDVGTLPIEKTKLHINKTFECYMPIWEALPSGYGVMIVPRRQHPDGTTIEYIDLLNGKNMDVMFGLS